ncbi:MAG: DUF962 domain-containing protein [Alteromonadaceae bacterium]|nr:DUF962 domain-containing protein [Alteromonadaceae bacterium]
MTKEQHFASFSEFYPYYLAEHQHPVCRRLHFIGSALVISLLLLCLVTQTWMLLWLVPLAGYGFAWLGHFKFEHNKPATFRYPLYSLMGDWVMFKDILQGKISLSTTDSKDQQ